jgi:hypothetical protein
MLGGASIVDFRLLTLNGDLLLLPDRLLPPFDLFVDYFLTLSSFRTYSKC